MPKILTTEQLTRLNNKAVRQHQNRVLSKEFIDALDPEGVHLVATHMMVDDDGTIRCHILSKLVHTDDPSVAILDMEVGEFNKLKDARA